MQAARTAPDQIATLILPSDASWEEGGVAADPLPAPPPSFGQKGPFLIEPTI